MRVAKIVLIGLILFALASWLTVYVYGRFAAQARGTPSQALAVAEDGTALDRVVATLTAEQPEMTGLRLVSDNSEAFAVRAHAARAAGRSLDLHYYYWRDDLTGSLLF